VPAKPELDIEAILRTLDAHGVDCIVVGGVCAILHGAPVATFDLDVVHARNAANVRRLLDALEELDACYRVNSEKRMKPSESHLASRGHQLLMTRFGPLDVLGLIGSGREYEALAPHTVVMEIGGGLKVRLLNLQTLIETKQETAGEKDRAVLTILRRVLRERQSS
jgi:hypothetical protein